MTPRKEVIKERQIRLHKPLGMEKEVKVPKPYLLFTHYFMDNNNDAIILNAEIWIMKETNSMKIITEETDTKMKDEIFIDLAQFIDEKFLPNYYENLEELEAKIQDLFNTYAIVEKDPINKGHRIVFTPEISANTSVNNEDSSSKDYEISGAMKGTFPLEYNYDYDTVPLEDHVMIKQLSDKYNINY